MRISDWSSDVCSSDLYEWKSGDCKYERKRDRGGYKEEYKCAGYPRHAGGPPAWAPAHGYRRDEYRDYGLARPPIDLGIGRCNREVIGKLLGGAAGAAAGSQIRSEEHTYELQSIMRTSYDVFC